MVRQNDIKGAYTKVGDPSVKRSSGAGGGRIFVVVGFLLVAALFVSMGRSTSQNAVDDNLHSGQAHHATTGTNVDTPSSSSSSSFSSYVNTEDEDESESDHTSRQPPVEQSSGDEDDGSGGEHKLPGSTSSSSKSGSTTSKSRSSSSGDEGDDDGGQDDGSGDDDVAPSSSGGSSGSKKGGSSNGSTGQSSSSSSSGSGNNPVPSDDTTEGGGDGEEEDPDASETDKAEHQVAQELRQAEKEEVKREEEKVQSTLSKIGSGLRIGLGRLFGDKASTQEIEEIAVAVEEEVTAEVDRDIEAESTTVLKEKLQDIEEEIEGATMEGTPDHEIAEEIKYKRTEAVKEMRHSMDEIEERVEKSIQARTSMAEKKILEEKLSKKLGKTVTLTIVEDEEGQFEGLDEAIESLPSLRGTDPKKKKKKKGTSLGGELVGGGSTSRLDGQNKGD